MVLHSVTIADTCQTADAILRESVGLFSLCSTCPPSFQPSWLRTFIRYYGPQRNIALTIVSDPHHVRLLAPWQILDRNTVIFLCDTTADYNDNLYNQPAVEYLQAAVTYWLSSGIKCIRLSKLPSDSITIAIAQQVAANLGLAVTVETCDHIPIRKLIPSVPVEDWPGVSRSRVKKYRSLLRRLTKAADVSFRYISSVSELSRYLPAMMNLHIERWASLGMVSRFLDKKRRLFTQDICNESCRSGSLLVPLLLIDETVAAYQVWFCSGNTIYDWNASFALKWSKWSPGGLLQLQSISDMSTQFAKYNFMRGEEPYKYYWTDEKEYTVTITLRIP